MNTVYLCLHIPGTYNERSKANKHGLRDALEEHGDVREIDFIKLSNAYAIMDAIRGAIREIDADLLFFQLQGAVVEPGQLRQLKADFPKLRIVSWNGDYWEHSLTSPEMIALLKEVDLQLVVNGSVLETYAQNGVKAHFCPFGYEAPIDLARPPMGYDVVYLGNNYSEHRQRLYEALRALPCRVGVFGTGWERSEGETNYDFARSEALYQGSRIAISDNQFPDAKGYMSDRPIQVLGAGGALLLQQTVRDLEAMTGLKSGIHYVEWKTFDDLPDLVMGWLNPERYDDAKRIVKAGQAFVLSEHTWSQRVRQLVEEWLPELERARA